MESAVLDLVVLPGLDGTGNLFVPFLAALGREVPVRVIAYPHDRPMGYADLAEWSRGQLPERDFVLLGESFSGPVAALIAAERPAHLRGLILSASFIRNPRPFAAMLSPITYGLPMSRTWARIAAPFLIGRRPDPALRDAFVQAVGTMASATMQARVRAVLDIDVSDAFAKVGVPILCLRAKRDLLVPRSASAWIRHVQPASRVVDVPGPHGLLQASARRCAELVGGFMAELAGNAAAERLRGGQVGAT
ncbi:MAG: alpha/beta hydrolase [Luteibacter sp.]